MFGNQGKQPAPGNIPDIVQKYLVSEKIITTNIAHILKAVIRKKTGDGLVKAFDIRIFDEGDATARKIKVLNFDSLDQNADTIIFEGYYDEGTKKVQLEQKRAAWRETAILTQDEIQQRIDSLTEPASTVFFFSSAGPSNGGPLGRGCTIVQLTPEIAGKKVKKYTVLTSNVIDDSPTDAGSKLFDSDKSKDLAKWIKSCHAERMY
jgi:hypothetical protein